VAEGYFDCRLEELVVDIIFFGWLDLKYFSVSP
jgi:hypothetical protein